MVNQPEVTAQMRETRAALSDNLETLENRVVDTVQNAAQRVAQTVEDVKEAVNDTVENVKDSFDLRVQVDRHPWAMVGGSIAVGYVGGYLLFRRSAALPAADGHRQLEHAGRPQITEQPNGSVKESCATDEASAHPETEHERRASGPGCPGGVTHQFEKEIANLKRLAIGTLLSLVRDVVTQSRPKPMQAGLAGAIDGITIELGGDPIQGPVLNSGQTAA